MEISTSALVLLPAIAVTAPLLVRGFGRWVAIPLVVFEIALGLVLGPAVLGWLKTDDFIGLFADFGLAMLFFLAGNEIDFRAIRGRPLGRAAIGWLISLAAGIGIAALLAPDIPSAAFMGIALTSTALGAILPVLRDSGDLGTPFGIAVVALGAVGEFGPLLAISLFLSGRQPWQSALVLLGFAVVATVVIVVAARGAGRRLHRVITATLHTSGQFAVRLVMFVLLTLVALSIVLDLDMLLGAFTAGVIYRLLLTGAPEHEAEVVESKLEAVGYGLLVPVFFINTGLTFDLEALLSDPADLVLVPIALVAFLIVRGLPSVLAAPSGSDRRDRWATALFGATGLPIIVAVTAIGVDEGDLDSGTAAALVGAGLLSVLVFPLLALSIRGPRSQPGATRAPQDDVGVPSEG
ncbi:cation:proton antiporter [Agromyces tardus]|uniref:Cation:proton antiporter n=1 Tax=Agromyces tardus TaxID=2583849 RepID=A0A3M8AH72_9MICO|nr:cation:proton antiporter [Agromyces tardus]RNB50500.1 cation:proton antiporter [Agromyces tardus]